MNPEYKCEEHKLDLVCQGCMKAWIARHDRMLKFIKKICYEHTDFEETAHISWDAAELLKEIGKLK